MMCFVLLDILVEFARSVWLPVCLIILWLFLSNGSTSIYFPPLADIGATLVRELFHGELGRNLLLSLYNLAIGLAFAIVLGVALGLIIGRAESFRRIVSPTLNFLRAVPPASIVPIIIIALGVGAAPKIFVIALGCFWPILLNTIDGVRGTSPALIETARAYRLPGFLFVFRVALPAALPQIMAGIRGSLAVGLVLMVISEFFGAGSGIGFYITDASTRFAIQETWAGTLLVGLMGYVLSSLFLQIERRQLYWFSRTTTTPRQNRQAGGAARPEEDNEYHDHGESSGAVEDQVTLRRRSQQELRADPCPVEPQPDGRARRGHLDRRAVGCQQNHLAAVLFRPASVHVGRGKGGRSARARARCRDRPRIPGLPRLLDAVDAVCGKRGLPAAGQGVPKAERLARAHECLEAVGLPGVGDRYPWQMSGGMQQRVAIARAIAYDAQILLMDEPFGSLDAQTRFELEDLVLSIRKRLAISIVVVTHDIDEAVYLADRVIVLSGHPAPVIDTVDIGLGADRDQIKTKADPRFATFRNRILGEIRRPKSA